MHIELGDPSALLSRIRELGMQAGVVVDGPTEFESVEPFLDERIDLLLVMTIKAGFGGQAFVAEHLSKVERADEIRRSATSPSGSRSTAGSPPRPPGEPWRREPTCSWREARLRGAASALGRTAIRAAAVA